MEHVVPLLDELAALLSCDEVTFVCQVPGGFGVGCLVDLPAERRPFDRVELHEHLWVVAEPVEEFVGGLLSDIDEPLEIFQPDVGKVHVYASMGSEECEADEIGPSLAPDCKLRVSNSILDLVDLLSGEVVLEIVVADFHNLEACLFGILDNVEVAKLVGGRSVFDSRIPKEPQLLGQASPRREFCRRAGLFFVGFNERLTAVEIEVLMHEGTFPYLLSLAALRAFESAAELVA